MGDDRLAGGAGRDVLIGGEGVDRFAFRAGDDLDIVRDFTDGADLLSFAGFGAAFDTADEIIDAATTSGASTLITLPDPGAGTFTTVRLVGLALASLDAGDFGSVAAWRARLRDPRRGRRLSWP